MSIDKFTVFQFVLCSVDCGWRMVTNHSGFSYVKILRVRNMCLQGRLITQSLVTIAARYQAILVTGDQRISKEKKKLKYQRKVWIQKRKGATTTSHSSSTSDIFSGEWCHFERYCHIGRGFSLGLFSIEQWGMRARSISSSCGQYVAIVYQLVPWALFKVFQRRRRIQEARGNRFYRTPLPKLCKGPRRTSVQKSCW